MSFIFPNLSARDFFCTSLGVPIPEDSAWVPSPELVDRFLAEHPTHFLADWIRHNRPVGTAPMGPPVAHVTSPTGKSVLQAFSPAWFEAYPANHPASFLVVFPGCRPRKAVLVESVTDSSQFGIITHSPDEGLELMLFDRGSHPKVFQALQKAFESNRIFDMKKAGYRLGGYLAEGFNGDLYRFFLLEQMGPDYAFCLDPESESDFWRVIPRRDSLLLERRQGPVKSSAPIISVEIFRVPDLPFQPPKALSKVEQGYFSLSPLGKAAFEIDQGRQALVLTHPLIYLSLNIPVQDPAEMASAMGKTIQELEVLLADMAKLTGLKIRRGFSRQVFETFLELSFQAKMFESVLLKSNEPYDITPFLLCVVRFLFPFDDLEGDRDWLLSLWLDWRKRAQLGGEAEMEALCDAKIARLAETEQPTQYRLTDHAARYGVRLYEELWTRFYEPGFDLKKVMENYTLPHQQAHHALVLLILFQACDDFVAGLFHQKLAPKDSCREQSLKTDFFQSHLNRGLLSQTEMDEASAEYVRLRGPLKTHGGGGGGNQIRRPTRSRVQATEIPVVQCRSTHILARPKFAVPDVLPPLFRRAPAVPHSVGGTFTPSLPIGRLGPLRPV